MRFGLDDGGGSWMSLVPVVGVVVSWTLCYTEQELVQVL
jgi:hypothetical protein